MLSWNLSNQCSELLYMFMSSIFVPKILQRLPPIANHAEQQAVCPWYPLSVDLHPSLLIFTGVSDYSLACHNSRAAYCCADHLLMRVQWEIDLLGNWFVHSDKLYHTLRFATAGRRLVWGIQKTSVHYSGFNSHSLYRITDMKLSNIQVSSFTNSRLVPTVTWEPILGQ